MAKGCKWYTENSNGDHWVSEFKGKKAGKYIVESHYKLTTCEKSNVAEYDADGLMKLRTWSDGFWEAYLPHSCYSVPGKCSQTYSASGGTKFRMDNDVSKNGGTYLTKAAPAGGRSYPDETFQMGPFHIPKWIRSSETLTKVTKFVGCGRVSS